MAAGRKLRNACQMLVSVLQNISSMIAASGKSGKTELGSQLAFEYQRTARNRALSFGQFVGIHCEQAKPSRSEASLRPREGAGIDDRVADKDRVRGIRFRCINVDEFYAAENARIHPGPID